MGNPVTTVRYLIGRLLSSGIRPESSQGACHGAKTEAGQDATHDAARRIQLANVFYLVTFVFALLMVGVNYLEGHYTWCGILAAVMAGSCAMFLALRITGNYEYTGSITVAGISLLGIMLLATGGVGNNGHLWFFVVPSILMFTFGRKTGAMGLAFLFLGAAVVLFSPGDILLKTTYPVAFRIRFLVAFLGASLFAAAAEEARHRYQKATESLMEELELCARTDPLTCLRNRRGMHESLTHEHYRAERTGKPWSIILCDIDHFKVLNDKFGHHCGDYVLRRFANTVQMTLRKQDIASRWGGEEFLLLLPETDHEGALVAAEKLRRAIAEMNVEYDGNPVTITASFGVHTLENETVEHAIHQADGKLYKAKHKGRNRIVGAIEIAPLRKAGCA